MSAEGGTGLLRPWWTALPVAVALVASLPVSGGAQETSDARPGAAEAREAFERLKGLEGAWEGPSTDAETGAVLFERARFEYRLTGAGSTLTERANAGGPEEMLSVFFMDGDRLVLQHYCSAGNQPEMELVDAGPDELVFDFVGGRNLDPERDGHIHRVRFTFSPDGPVESFWSWYEDGREDHVNRRVLHERR